ncbi:MAG TPA: hypothetical protein VKE74_27670 [Gemmataceae bacterium]|nr:hypothetical protein [Gemmataceae bacterium]
MIRRMFQSAVLSVSVLTAGFAGLLSTPTAATAASPGNADDWKAFSPKGGKFTVKMPGEPQKLSQQVDGLKVVLYGYEEADAGMYMVGYVDLPPGTVTGENTSEFLDQFVKGAAEGMDGKVLKSKAITLGKNPGREFTFSVPDIEGTGKCRAYLVSNRLYMVMAIGTEEFMGGEGVNTFLNSFKLTK